MATLSASASEKLNALVDHAVVNPKEDIPGVSVAITNRKGEILYSYAAGQLGSETTEKVTTESLYWIASCTKISGSIVALQAVEKGLVSLDSTEDVDKFLPELRKVPILKSITEEGEVTLIPKTKKITLRMLLSHTAGFGYSFFNHNLAKYCDLFGIDELSGNANCVSLPLNFEPGTDWEYGVGIDWACVMVARAEGVPLNELVRKNIFEAAGVKDTTMRPDKDQKQRLMKMNYRSPDGKLSERKQPMTAILSDDPVVTSQSIDSAGAGIFSRPAEYVKVLAILLNKGVSEITGKRILSEESVKTVFTNQIPQWPDFGRKGILAATPELTNPIPELYPQSGNPPQGWGLSAFLNLEESAIGRSANSGFWCGIANLYYWIDPVKGVAGMVGSQILPFGDLKVLHLFGEIEATVYKNLEPEVDSKLSNLKLN